jgi:hypothetical protein
VVISLKMYTFSAKRILVHDFIHIPKEEVWHTFYGSKVNGRMQHINTYTQQTHIQNNEEYIIIKNKLL